MLDRVLRYVYLLLFFAVPLVMASWTSELFEFNKIMVIYGASVIVFFLWGFKMILHKKIILKKTPFDIPIILFLLAQILATIFSIDFHTSLFGYYGRFNGGLISIIAYLILYYGAVSNFQASVVKRILLVSLAASGVAILWALPGKFGHDLSCLLFAGRFDNSCWTDQFRPSERLFSFLGQPNWYAQYLLIHFFLALYFLEGFFSRVTTRLWF
ncbi:hypothetical protein HY214_00360 [Candidatus Roizmanbacteria bacterium]|nr:hypothetical protein [Candidatus Roizmanbacteria bacterium]